MSIRSTGASDWESARADTQSARGPPNDDRVLSLLEFAKLAGISIANLRRQIRLGTGPLITRMSERRVGVRVKHARAWLDARAVAPKAA